ncbi:MAG TPA: thiamine pyrophosphate-requiring protein [Candidatus Lustribacter sp.]
MFGTDSEGIGGAGHRWVEVPADEVADAIIAALALGGIECVFFTSGSEIVFFQEAIAKAEAHGRPAPRIISMTHEHAGLNAALGYAAISGKPVATAVHVDAGTLNYGAAIHTASRSGLPVLMMAGAPPTAYPGSMRGARDRGGHIWFQQTFDQNTIVRQYVKWDHRLEYQDNAGLLVSRAIQVALSQPTGPVYLSIPREIALLPADGATFPTARQLGIPHEPWPDPNIIRAIVERLVTARAPVMIVSGSGRNPQTECLLVALCELLAIRVVIPTPHGVHSFPMSHPLYDGTGKVRDADVIIVLETKVPWLPGADEPAPDAFIAAIGIDPIQAQIPTYEFTADQRLIAGALPALQAMLDAARTTIGTPAPPAVAERKLQLAERSRARRAEADRIAVVRKDATPIDPLWLSYQIGRVLDANCVVFDDTLAHNRVPEYLHCDLPGSYFNNPGTSGGWAPGAAFGAKLADPQRDMVAVTGDGFFMFGTTNAAITAAHAHGAPFLSIVYQNRSYTTGTVSVTRTYRESYSAKAGFPGGYLDPPIDFAEEAHAAGAYSENVRDPSEVEPALRRGLAATRSGRAAVLAFWLPRLLGDD